MVHQNKRIGPTDTFHVAFDTKTYPGKIVSTAITVRQEITSDEAKTFRIDFANHPLFKAVARYCIDNLDDATLEEIMSRRDEQL